MFQPSGSQDAPADAGDAGRKSSQPPVAPAVDPRLRAGAKLAQARELRGLSLDEIAKDIHVRRDYLEALEAMNVKLLPGKAYALAYLKSYAKVLGLEPEAIARQFREESALTREDAQPQLRNPESKPGRERPWLGALAIAGLVAGFIGWQALEAARRGDPRLETAGQSAAPPAPAPMVPAAGSQLAAAPAAAAAPDQIGPVDAAPAPVIEIKALQQAWLEVRGPDGTIFLSRTLQPGDRYRPEVGAGWRLHATDGSAFDVAVDGVSIGPLGRAGEPVLGRRVDTLASTEAAVAPKPAPAVKKPVLADVSAAAPAPDQSQLAAPDEAAPAPAPPAAF